jgi:hypothetical protein
MIRWMLIAAAAAAPALAAAKLPPPDDAAKAKAAEAAAKGAWQGKVDGYLLCKAQDRVVDKYKAMHRGEFKPGPATPPCTDPGPFAYAPPAAAAPAAAPAPAKK